MDTVKIKDLIQRLEADKLQLEEAFLLEDEYCFQLALSHQIDFIDNYLTELKSLLFQ